MITRINISSSQLHINKDTVKKSILSKLVKNQVIQAKVLNLLPDNKVELQVFGQKVIAKSAMSLSLFEDVQLKVLQEKDSIVLKLLGPAQKMTSKQVSSLVSFFSKNNPIPDISKSNILNIKDILNDIALKSDKADHDFLPRLIEKGGLSWEKKIAHFVSGKNDNQSSKTNIDHLLKQDIKGSLLKELFFSDFQKGAPAKAATPFFESVENFQQLNNQTSESGRFLLPFPVFSESGFEFGQLLIDLGEKNKDDKSTSKKVVNISFLLNMTQLGPVRADFSVLNQAITGRFLLQDEAVCQFMQSLIPDLKDQLSKVDYKVHQIECKVAKKEEIQESIFIESLIKTNDDTVLNIVI